MKSTHHQIMKRVNQRSDGYVFTPKDFLDLGTREAIDTALSRLARQGSIRRLSRGLYDNPKKTHFVRGTLTIVG